MIYMASGLMGEVDNMQKQTGKISREVETLRKNQKEMPGMKSTVMTMKMKMKNAFDELGRRRDMVPRKESVSLRYVNRKFPKWNAKEKRNRPECVRSVGQP